MLIIFGQAENLSETGISSLSGFKSHARVQRRAPGLRSLRGTHSALRTPRVTASTILRDFRGAGSKRKSLHAINNEIVANHSAVLNHRATSASFRTRVYSRIVTFRSQVCAAGDTYAKRRSLDRSIHRSDGSALGSRHVTRRCMRR